MYYHRYRFVITITTIDTIIIIIIIITVIIIIATAPAAAIVIVTVICCVQTTWAISSRKIVMKISISIAWATVPIQKN